MADLHIHANLAIAAGAVFIPVCTCCVGLRVYARRMHGVNLGADDWTVIIALVGNNFHVLSEGSRLKLVPPSDVCNCHGSDAHCG